MTKMKLYKYVGRNGSITTPVLLDDAKHYVVYELKSDSDKILFNGEVKKRVTVVYEDELNNWREIPDNTVKED